MMNEVISVAAPYLQTLNMNVMDLLSSELKGTGIVTLLGNQLIVKIDRADFEQRLGNLLQHIQSVIDSRFPVRDEHLSVIIRDNEARYENVFKIWKSV